MIEHLEGMVGRYRGINETMMLPEIVADNRMLAKLECGRADLTRVVEAYTEYKSSVSALKDTKVPLLEDDKEVKEMAKMEVKELEPKIEGYLGELKALLIPKDPNDSHSTIIEVHRAAGGDEGNILASNLYRMYGGFAESQGWKAGIVEVDNCEAGGFSLVSFVVKGSGVRERLKFEPGSRRVQRIPRTESQGHIHTSTATVLVTPEIGSKDFDIDMNGLGTETMRTGGAGGRRINKTDSATHVVHKFTEITIKCQDGRSQYENRATTLMTIHSRAYEEHQCKLEEEQGVERRNKIGTGGHAEKIRTYNYPWDHVIDHCIGYTVNQLDRIMEGRTQDLLNILLSADQ